MLLGGLEVLGIQNCIGKIFNHIRGSFYFGFSDGVLDYLVSDLADSWGLGVSSYFLVDC